jgi:hypothetical protein
MDTRAIVSFGYDVASYLTQNVTSFGWSQGQGFYTPPTPEPVVVTMEIGARETGGARPERLTPLQRAFGGVVDVKKVLSSTIYAMGYDENSKTLRVMFTTGSVYDYNDVERNEYENIVKSQSVGKYFQSNIRNVYQYKKIK